MAVGVLALVVALALMTGLQGEVRDRIVGSAAHVYVWKVGEGGVADYAAEAERLKTVPRVVGAAPAILGKALVTTDRGEAFITVKGIDPALESQVTDIAQVDRAGHPRRRVRRGHGRARRDCHRARPGHAAGLVRRATRSRC